MFLIHNHNSSDGSFRGSQIAYSSVPQGRLSPSEHLLQTKGQWN